MAETSLRVLQSLRKKDFIDHMYYAIGCVYIEQRCLQIDPVISTRTTTYRGVVLMLSFVFRLDYPINMDHTLMARDQDLNEVKTGVNGGIFNLMVESPGHGMTIKDHILCK